MRRRHTVVASPVRIELADGSRQVVVEACRELEVVQAAAEQMFALVRGSGPATEEGAGQVSLGFGPGEPPPAPGLLPLDAATSFPPEPNTYQECDGRPRP